LSSFKVLNYEGPRPESPSSSSKKNASGVNSIKMRGSSIREGLHERDFDDDEDEY